MSVTFTTAGESHGPALISILEGLPAGIPLVAGDVNSELARRQQGYGRGRRMQIETDTVEFLSGVRAGETLGSPISMIIQNRDWKNWQEIMDPAPREGDPSEHLLWHLELADLPDHEAAREIAYRFGDRLEDAWGSGQRRYLAHRGDFVDRLDARRVS